MPSPLSSPRTAVLAVALLLGAALGVVVGWAALVLLAAPHAAAAAAGVAVQTAAQAATTRVLFRVLRGSAAAHAAYALAGWGIVVALVAGGASAFASQAAVALTVLPAGAAACVGYTVSARRREDAVRARGREALELEAFRATGRPAIGARPTPVAHAVARGD
jgi:hypothetical protein